MNQQNGMYQKSDSLGQTECLKQEEKLNNVKDDKQLLEYITGVNEMSFSDADKLRKFRLILFYTTRMCEYKDMIRALKTIQSLMGNIRLCEMSGKYIVILTGTDSSTLLEKELSDIAEFLKKQFTYKFNILYSEPESAENLPMCYIRMVEKSEYNFYFESDVPLCEAQVCINDESVTVDYAGLERALKYGDTTKAELILNGFFNSLKEVCPKPESAKLICYSLYACIIRCCPSELLEEYMAAIEKFRQYNNVFEIEKFITESALRIVDENDPHNAKSYSNLIKDTVKIINDNIGNENLSLRWLAGTILFTNVDYLGKLFKKETGKNFSHYVMEKRMELAKELIIEKDRVYEVAEQVGYGSNSQYFSHVFKKYTGVSPLEYKEYAKLNQSVVG